MTADTRDWSYTKRRIRERWPGLGDEEIEASNGDRDALIALLQGRLGYAKENAEQDVAEILGGEVIVPEDVADEQVHTGTSGPVGPVSEATDFTGGAHNQAAGGEREHGQPPSTMQYGTAQSRPAGLSGESPVPEGRYGSGSPPTAGGEPHRWERDPWEAMNRSDNNGGRMWSVIPMIAVNVVVLVGAVVVVRMLLNRRKRKRTRADQVTEQARHLLEDITERVPSVDELREKVRSLEEMREKKMAGARRG